MSNDLAIVVSVGEPGWYVPRDMWWCPRCGDQNYDDKRLCITCTVGDEHYRDGQYRDGWRP